MPVANQDKAQHVGFGLGQFTEAQDALSFAGAAEIAADDDRRPGRAMGEQDRRRFGEVDGAPRRTRVVERNHEIGCRRGFDTAAGGLLGTANERREKDPDTGNLTPPIERR